MTKFSKNQIPQLLEEIGNKAGKGGKIIVGYEDSDGMKTLSLVFNEEIAKEANGMEAVASLFGDLGQFISKATDESSFWVSQEDD